MNNDADGTRYELLTLSQRLPVELGKCMANGTLCSMQ